METRANYFLVGVFALAGLVGLLVFFLWFARLELDRQFAYYDIFFDSAAGLGAASDVRYSGLPVGRVVDVSLSASAPGAVLVRIEVAADTPVRTDSIATIEAQGITGGSFVAISDGSPGAPLLVAASDEPVPDIEAGRSVLQTLTEDAPQVMEEVLVVLEQLRGLMGEDNQRRVEMILANVEDSSGNFSDALDDFAAVSGSIAGAAEGITAFADQLDAITEVGTETMRTAEVALVNLSDLALRAQTTLGQADTVLASTRNTVDAAGAFVTGDLSPLVRGLDATATELRADLGAIAGDARGMIAQFNAAGTAATARLQEAEATLAATDDAIVELVAATEAVYDAATEFDALLTTDGAALVAETRAAVAEGSEAFATISAVAENDLPAIVADIRDAATTANAAIAAIGTGVSDALGDVDAITADAEAALEAATVTFRNANQTLTALNEALAVAQGTLAAAEETFVGADRILDEEVAGIVAMLNQTLARIDTAIAQVAEDVPVVTAELREAAEGASAAIAGIEGTVGTLGAPLRTFATTGLPQYTGLAQEARSLVDSLERLVQQIERDPARFFFDTQGSEFRR